jgi:hypothetical protein
MITDAEIAALRLAFAATDTTPHLVIGSIGDEMILVFPPGVDWLSVPPAAAIEIARTLVKAAYRASISTPPEPPEPVH